MIPALDQSLYDILASLPPLPFAKLLKPRPASIRSSRDAFFAHGRIADSSLRFEYAHARTFAPPSRHPSTGSGCPELVEGQGGVREGEQFVDRLAQVKQSIERAGSPDLLKNCYLAKLKEIEQRHTLVSAVAQGDDDTVSRLSLEMYGAPPHNLEAFEQEFTDRLNRVQAGDVRYHEKVLDAKAFSARLEQSLAHYDLTNWEIKLSARRRLQCSHKPRSQSFVMRIPKNLSLTKKRAQRLIAHEIEVHILRRTNGAKSELRLLELGFAGYHKTEEGLALYHQHLLDTVPRKHPPGFWDAWTAALMYKLGFAETFERLRQAHIDLLTARQETDIERRASEKAWGLCLRASRGITHPGQPGIGFFKDHIYRQGYLELCDAIATEGAEQILPLLFAGKVGLSDLPTLRELGVKPGKFPDQIQPNSNPNHKHTDEYRQRQMRTDAQTQRLAP